MHKKIKNFRVILLFLLLLSLPLTTTIVQQVQEIRQRAQTASVTISIREFQFVQSSVTIRAGTRVTWVNNTESGLLHTSSSDVQGTSNSWDSGFINPGQSFSRTFNTPGTFQYHCNVHPSMRGTIIVVPADQPTLTPTPTRSPVTPTPTPVRAPTPTPTKPNTVPSPVCLGSCPTSPPSPTATLTPTPTLEPCVNESGTQVGSVLQSSTDNTEVAGNNKKKKDKDKEKREVRQSDSFFNALIEFFFLIIRLLFGPLGGYLPSPAVPAPTPTYAPEPTEQPEPTDYEPTEKPEPTEYEPTEEPDPTDPYESPTPSPTEYPDPTEKPTVYPTDKPVKPTATPTQYPSPTPTPTPTPDEEPAATLKPCPPTVTLAPTAKITVSPAPSMSVAPSRALRSVDDFRYKGGNEPLKEFNLTAEVIDELTGKWGFNGKIHGPEIRVKEGDRVKVNFTNNLPDSTTIHWHGIRIFASQDGVAGVTQNAIPAGTKFTYDYVVPDAGTYWYHPHQHTSEQLPKGLYAPLIVEPKKGITQDRDYVVMYDNQTTERTHEFAANPGETVRVRLISAREPSFTGEPVTVALIGAPFKVVAIDGQDINKPTPVQNQLVNIMIATRYDLEFTMPASGSAIQIYEKEGLQTAKFGTGSVETPPNLNTLPDFSYMNYGSPLANDPRIPRNTFDAEHTMVIGQNLSINGKLMPNIPDLVVKEGNVVLVKWVNNSNMHHAMHLHGLFYKLLKKNDIPLTGSPVYMDVIDVAPGESVEAAVYADNPGVWMVHCHVLGHASVGMMMLMKFEDVFTPYKFGPGTGNVPE